MKNTREAIEAILFNIGKEIKIHTLGKDMIIEIDYAKYVDEIMSIIENAN